MAVEDVVVDLLLMLLLQAGRRKESSEDAPVRRPLTKPRHWLRTTEAARLLDKGSRIIFPLSFVVFNLIYWMIYLKIW